VHGAFTGILLKAFFDFLSAYSLSFP
jgi:hypothetical protein